MSLKVLSSALHDEKLPRRGVVITFDDGYVDNLQYAKPLLEQHDIPATVFITAGQLDRESEFWWDELERLFLQPGELPPTLSLSVQGENYQWDVAEAKEFTKGDYEQFQNWHIERPDDPSPRHKLYRSIYQLLHSMQSGERQEIIEKLRIWADKDSMHRPSYRVLTSEELVLFGNGGLIEIGAHTMTHPMLANLSASMQRAEIMQSKACLESILNRPVHSFAYPHGSYTDGTIALIKETGFNYACSSDTDAVWRGADPFKIPRVVVRDWDGGEFARWLKGWLGN
jgi:peptidoglycan/xylan/chitin deacetylase (PgdA/CDA1 family)